MATSLDQIVNVTISQQTAQVPQAGFGIPLFVGFSNRFLNSDLIRYYTSPDAMIADGFLVSDPEYVRGLEAFEQALSPTQIGIGNASAAVTQIDTISVTEVDAHQYKVGINGVDYSHTAGTGETSAQVISALIALINADSNAGAVASGSSTLILSGKFPGAGFTTNIHADANMSLVHTMANHSIVDDLIAIQAQSDLWYGLGVCSAVASDILQIAAWIESQLKIYIPVSADAAVKTSATSDVGSILKGNAYKRTALIFSALTDGKEAGWMGGVLPTIPGSSTWKFKQAVGTTPDVFSQSERNILIGQPGIPGKNVNIYEVVGGQAIFEEGVMAGGQFIDVTIGIDWLKSTMQNNVYALLVQAEKIPYTDIGATVIENAIQQTLRQAANNGLVDGTTIEVSVPAVLSVPVADRANRVLPDVKFSCRLAGAFHFIKINGVVTV